MFVDYAGATLPVIDATTGTVRQAQLFVAVLGASNHTFAEATWTQTLPDWIGSHGRALAWFGGVPAQIVSDNLKAGVTKACFYEPAVNRTYADMAAHYDTAVVPARPYKPRRRDGGGRGSGPQRRSSWSSRGSPPGRCGRRSPGGCLPSRCCRSGYPRASRIDSPSYATTRLMPAQITTAPTRFDDVRARQGSARAAQPGNASSIALQAGTNGAFAEPCVKIRLPGPVGEMSVEVEIGQLSPQLCYRSRGGLVVAEKARPTTTGAQARITKVTIWLRRMEDDRSPNRRCLLLGPEV